MIEPYHQMELDLRRAHARLDLADQERAVLDVVLEGSVALGRTWAQIPSLAVLADAAGLTRSHVCERLNTLEAKRLIEREREADGSLRVRATLEGSRWAVIERGAQRGAKMKQTARRAIQRAAEADQLPLLAEEPNLAAEVQAAALAGGGRSRIGNGTRATVPESGTRFTKPNDCRAKLTVPESGTPLKSKESKEPLSSKVKVPVVEAGGEGRQWEWLRDELAKFLGPDVWANDGGKWVNRIFGNRAKQIPATPRRVERAFAQARIDRMEGKQARAGWGAVMEYEYAEAGRRMAAV